MTERRGRLIATIATIVGLSVAASAAVLVIYLVRRPPEISVIAAHLGESSRMLAVTGRVEAEHTVLVTPRFAGQLTEIVRHEGDRVVAGETLARLADTSATASIVQQQAALASRQDDLAQARRDLADVTKLVASSAVAASELDSARLAVSRASHDVVRLGAVLHDGRSQLVLEAPFAGTIIRREGELGQVVGPTTTVFEIATVETSRITAEIDERYVRSLRLGMHAEIRAVGTDDAPRAASISYIAQAVDPQTGAATVRFSYDTKPEGALVGMSVDVDVLVGTTPDAVTIPRETIGVAGNSTFVLVIAHDRVERRPITFDDWPASWVVVRSGVAAGELVVLDPSSAVVTAHVRSRLEPDGL